MKNENELRKVREVLSMQNNEDMFLNVGYGRIKTHAVVALLVPSEEGRPSVPPPDLKEGKLEGLVRRVMKGRDDGGIKVNGMDDVLVRYSKCCAPLPGDDILGFITRGRGITVHRRACTKALDLDPERRVEITWDSKAKI